MILGETPTAASTAATLDDLFRRAGVRHPDALALADPPNRQNFTDGIPRALSFAQADRAISAIAARLRGLGLQTDSAVAIQLAEHRGKHRRFPRRTACGHDPAAPAVALAARRNRVRPSPGWRQSHHRLLSLRPNRSNRNCHAECGRIVFDPSRLRLRARIYRTASFRSTTYFSAKAPRRP